MKCFTQRLKDIFCIYQSTFVGLTQAPWNSKPFQTQYSADCDTSNSLWRLFNFLCWIYIIAIKTTVSFIFWYFSCYHFNYWSTVGVLFIPDTKRHRLLLIQDIKHNHWQLLWPIKVNNYTVLAKTPYKYHHIQLSL